MGSELSVADVLERAADLIEPEGAWVQRELGFDATGERIRDASHIGEAVCFCAAGAIWRVANVKYEDDDAVIWQAFDAVTSAAKWKSGIGPWNDAPGRTQAEVVAKFREAAALARTKGPGND